MPGKRQLFELASELARSGRSYVVATVVRREGRSSAHQGDMAIVADDGSFHGWIGGGCTRPTVEREAALALQSQRPRLVILTPEPARDPRAEVLVFPMTCMSGGTVEIYLDPVMASPRLALFGRSPIISSLAQLASAIGYLVDVADPDAQADELPAGVRIFNRMDAAELDGAQFAVVGTMGDFDEEAVARALAIGATYAGVIASGRRYALLRDALLARGLETAALAPVTNPAGLDLGAKDAGEVAVSILAQIVARRNAVAEVKEVGASRTALPDAGAAVPMAAGVATAIDPICGMTVTIAGAKHVAEWNGRTWYFCRGGCKTKFLAAPDLYAKEAV